ncbi:MAG: flagellar motor switch protein FliN [SAR324 cluster bacterium]|nr:flagellar motor switch protein FliN [SAR324 cluster bacterium]
MGDEDFESFDNLDDLDWSDVEEDLKRNREMVISEAQKPEPAMASPSAAMPTGGGVSKPKLPDGSLDIDFLLDVELQISVEVGRTQIMIQDLLGLNETSIVELNSLIGQPLDIRVNEKLVARGEVVVINDKFAVKITEIVSPDDRFAAL